LKVFEDCIEEMLPRLMPGLDFNDKRERIRLALEQAIQSTDVVPPNTRVALYGSSRNNFGNDNADLDMCLVLPLGSDILSEDRPAMIEKLGTALEALGMIG
jgi:hypothetical protein